MSLRWREVGVDVVTEEAEEEEEREGMMRRGEVEEKEAVLLG